MAGTEGASQKASGKSSEAFRTISEVADALEVPQHVLRFWESKFSQVRPLKRGGGRRYYRPEDVELLQTIRGLLYEDGYTIKGVQKLLRDGSLKKSSAVSNKAETAASDDPPVAADDQSDGSGLTSSQRRALREVADELEQLKQKIDEALG